MSLPAAAPPLAVLVLAWDETTPAVRALVEATETATPVVDSVVVVVPAGPDALEPTTQEEFLPLHELPPLPESSPATTPGAVAKTSLATTAAEVAATPTVAELPIQEANEGTAPASPTEVPVPAILASDGDLLPEADLPAFSPAPVWSGVQVLRLSSLSLPALAARAGQALPAPAWTGTGATPVAPYRGSSVAPVPAAERPVLNAYLTRQVVSAAAPQPLPPGPALPSTVPGMALATLPAVPPAEAATSRLLADFENSSASSTGLSANELTRPAAPELPTEADVLPAGEAPLATLFSSVRADWPAALAALHQPAEEWEETATAGEAAAYAPAEVARPADPPAVLAAAIHPFEAPDLNFQIIQYARFAVPVVLAQAPFGVIYAPAWPTWLAAQELRRRTGQPLVLHVRTLAAPPTDSLELAAGWQAELQRQALRRADLVLAETPALAQRLRHELELPSHAVRVVPAADAAAVAQALRTARPRPGQ